MKNDELQIENGNFTRIVNPLIENLIKIPFKGCEIAVALFIIRKTYGFQKKKDEISLTQFQQGLSRSRQTIVSALKNLQLVNVVRLVKRGDSKKQSNCWIINKYYNTWQLVNMARLVKRKRGTSLTKPLQLVKTARHTKESTKESTKERERETPTQIVKNFFNNSDIQEKFINQLRDKYNTDYNFLKAEIQKFILYWTEPNKNGTKQRWELQKTFEITRRLITWFNNSNKFNKQNYEQQSTRARPSWAQNNQHNNTVEGQENTRT